MRHRTKLVMSGLVAAIALSAAVGTAHARRFEFSSQSFLSIWSGTNKLTFEAAELFTVACSATLEGSFHSRTLSKVSGQLVGYVTEARIARPCEGGDAWFQNGIEEVPGEGRPNTLPWHVRYDSFITALPNITGIRLQVINMGFLVHNGLANCLFITSAAKPAFGILERNALSQITGLRWDETKLIPIFQTLAGFCAETKLKGKGSYSVQRSSTVVTVRLVQ